MKKTLTINLSGIVFNIDEDAYELLQRYLDSVEKHFPDKDDREILSDIETRIAELLSDMLRVSKTEVVTTENVESVIATLGNPEQFDDNEGDTASDEKCTEEEPSDKTGKKADKEQRKKYRKFYRDVDNQLIGGVGSGIAAYFGWDVTVVRLILLILIFITSGYVIPAYLIVWLIAPGANSTAQKLEMNGIEPSIENIKRYFESEQFRTSTSRIGSRLSQIICWLFKAAAIVFGICIASGGIFIVAVILVALISTLVGTGSVLLEEFAPFFGGTTSVLVICAVSALFVVIIPIVAIIVATVRLIRRDDNPVKPRHSVMGWIWLVVWIIAVVTFFVTLFSTGTDMVHNVMSENTVYEYGSKYDYTEERLVGESFDALKVSSGLRVRLCADTVSFVEVKGTERGLRATEASISGQTLNLSVRNTGSRTELPLVIVHYNNLQSIRASSAANVSNNKNDMIKTKMLDIDASSAARINVAVDCESMAISSSSAARVDVEGVANRVVANCSAASKIDMEHLYAGYVCAVAASGSDIELRADTINIKAASGSSVEYAGSPVIELMDSNSGGSIKSSED